MEISGGADADLGGNLSGAYMKAGVNGKLDCAPLSIHANGNASLKLNLNGISNMQQLQLITKMAV